MKFDDKNDKNKFWVDLMGKNDDGKMKCTSRVRLQIDVLPIHIAVKNPVGKARNAPNHSPFLPQPEGRMEFSMNPLKMFNQLMGPAFKRYLYCALCCAICLIVFLPALPSILGGLMVEAIV